MLLLNVRNKNEGFTLIETLIIVVIIGILSAIAAPSFLGILNRNKVSSTLSEVRGAFQEAQRESMRKGMACTVKLNKTTNTVSSTPSKCLVTGTRTLDSSVGMETKDTPIQSIQFSHRGTIILNDGTTLVFFNKDNYSNKKCLVISSPLGIMRDGIYTGQIPSDSAHPIQSDPNCKK